MARREHMSNLKVDELEPRQMLNGTGFGSQVAPLQLSAIFTETMAFIERSPLVDYGGHLDRTGWVVEVTADVGLLRSVAFSGFDGKVAALTGLHAPGHESFGASRSQPGAGGPARGAADL